MDKIYQYEQALRLNKVAIAKLTNNTDPVGQKEHRLLLLQRTNLKDRLIDAYREKYLSEVKLTKENV